MRLKKISYVSISDVFANLSSIISKCECSIPRRSVHVSADSRLSEIPTLKSLCFIIVIRSHCCSSQNLRKCYHEKIVGQFMRGCVCVCVCDAS